MTIKTVLSEDGIEYRALEIPGTVELSDVFYAPCPQFPDEYEFIHVYVSCEQIRTICLPLDANPREPTRADVVRKMSETLLDNPSVFHHWNNGITIICENVSYNENDKKMTISFSGGEGICNGGHTYFSIVTQPNEIDSNALVHLELIKLSPSLEDTEKRQVITDIANRRNRNRQLLQSSQADHLGYYDFFKECLGESANLVRWHEGDSNAGPGAIKSELFVRMLACVDPFWFIHPVHTVRGNSHKTAATGSASIHNKWYDGAVEGNPEKNLRHMGLLGMDLFKLVDYLSYSLLHDSFSDASPRFRGTSFWEWIGSNRKELQSYHRGQQGLDLPAPALIMILGAFRSNVWLSVDEDGDPNFIGFVEDPMELWSETRIDLIRDLLSLFEDRDRDPNQFIKQSAPYDKSLLQILYGRNLPEFPNFFYDIETKTKYEMSETPAHYLVQTCPQSFTLHDVVDGLPSGAKGYVAVLPT